MTKPDKRLDTNELAKRLQPSLIDVISHTRSLTSLAASLSRMAPHQQTRAVHWIEVIARTNAELAFQFAISAPRAFNRLTLPEIDAWVLQAMHAYDHHGLYAAATELKQLDRFVALKHRRQQAVTLKKVSPILETFLQGLSGRHMTIETSEEPWTDTASVFLPESISRFEDSELNFGLYKSMAALLWAQTWFGTFALDVDGELKLKALSVYDDIDKACSVFLRLDSERLLIRIENELPGLGRQMRKLAGEQDLSDTWRQVLAKLDEESTVDDCLANVSLLFDETVPQAATFQPALRIPVTNQTIQARIDLQREQLKQALNKLVPDAARQKNDRPDEQLAEALEADPQQFKIVKTPGGDSDGVELSFKGNMITPSPEVEALLQSILQDLGEIPLDYLVAGGSADPGQPRGTNVETLQSDEDVAAGLPYPEWDFRRGHYRQDWCYLRELEIEDGPENFVGDTLQKYSTVLPQLRKSFEALRGEDRWLRRQLDGDEIDIDALVEALADMRGGEELSDRLYTRLSRIDRNIAVMLMIDMSGSTKGWVNDAERESLVLLCQALEILGDQYAIYGFSGMTRKRCELYRIKQFDEPYSTSIERRISGISAKDYTRMGVTIRHLNRLLELVPAKTKLLITLSDGKPEDFDGYGGDYGIEDTRQALIESRRLGIHPFCITIDSEASSYLPHMYGAHSYAVVDDVRSLPLRVADVYRRLTH